MPQVMASNTPTVVLVVIPFLALWTVFIQFACEDTHSANG